MVILALFTAWTSEGSQEVQTPELETETMQLVVGHDFGASPATPDTKLSGVEAETIEVGEGRAAILAIERPTFPARCLIAAQLRLYLEAASPLADEQLAIYPSHVFNPAEKGDGDEFGYSGSALDTRPRATMSDAGSGWSQWDVTDIVSRWMSGRFPSKNARAPKRGRSY